MSIAEPGTIGGKAGLDGRLTAVPLAAACLIAVAAFAALDLASDSGRLAKALGDTDDATRLVQVREFLAGASWFDTTLPRFGAGEALVSHWSRLIDLGLAGMIRVFGLVMPKASAEMATRTIWPLLLMLPLLWAMASWCAKRSGNLAA